MIQYHIVLIEDDEDIREMVTLYLEKNQMQVTSFVSGLKAITWLNNHTPDLILLDIMLPEMNGYDICKKIRSFSDVPILFMSAKSEEFDKIYALRLGGDDYVTKPFSYGELVARVHSILRRYKKEQDTETTLNYPFPYGMLSIDFVTQQVFLNDTPIDLPSKEFQILLILATNNGKPLHLAEIYKRIWGTESNGDVRTVMVHVSNLRKRLNSVIPIKIIHTVRGIGYKFDISKKEESFD